MEIKWPKLWHKDTPPNINLGYTEGLILGLEVELMCSWDKPRIIKFLKNSNKWDTGIDDTMDEFFGGLYRTIHEEFKQDYYLKDGQIVFKASRDERVLVEIKTHDIYPIDAISKHLDKLKTVVNKYGLIGVPNGGIHVSFNTEQKLVSNNINQFIRFFVDNNPFIYNFSGRTADKQFRVNPNFDTVLGSDNKAITNRIIGVLEDKWLNSVGLYITKNVGYPGRIELKWFASSHKIAIIKAYLELIDAMFNFININKETITLENLLLYINFNKEKFPNLVKRIRKIKLFRYS